VAYRWCAHTSNIHRLRCADDREAAVAWPAGALQLAVVEAVDDPPDLRRALVPQRQDLVQARAAAGTGGRPS
jgi:hypothetical protein